jgi:hypothetical protein
MNLGKSTSSADKPAKSGPARAGGHIDDDFQGIGGRPGGQGDGGSGLFQREMMGDQAAHVQPAGKNQAGDFTLEGKIG